MTRKIMSGFYIISLIFTASCQPIAEEERDVYFNDFDEGETAHITGGKLSVYNGTQVIGNYHNGGFNLDLARLPPHEYVVISFDLYIHDTWDGNMINPIGPDKWYMTVNGFSVIETTFSNGICNSAWCPQQSFPDNGWRMHDPKTGAFKDKLPIFCPESPAVNANSLYKITKVIEHPQAELCIKFFDHLSQPIANDICDESWSLDNLAVKVFSAN